MKKLIASMILVLSAGSTLGAIEVPGLKGFNPAYSSVNPNLIMQRPVQAVPQEPVSCLPQGTSLIDTAAQKWSSYERCMKSNMCGMMAPQGPRNSMKFGPGSPEYEKYKTCAQKNGQTPAPAIYSTIF